MTIVSAIPEKNNEFLTFTIEKEERENTLENWGLGKDFKIGDEYCLVIVRIKDDEIGLRLKKK